MSGEGALVQNQERKFVSPDVEVDDPESAQRRGDAGQLEGGADSDDDDDDDGELDVVIDFGDAAFSAPLLPPSVAATTTNLSGSSSSSSSSSSRFPSSVYSSYELPTLPKLPFFLPSGGTIPSLGGTIPSLGGTIPSLGGTMRPDSTSEPEVRSADKSIESPLTPAMCFELSTLHERDKPWLKPGAKMHDYFNHGFDEGTYTEHQKKCLAFLRSLGCEIPPSPPVRTTTTVFPPQRPH
jgi:hypothetical protein